ncbi:DNA resolvase [Acetobacter estunensis NRIC 0472]|uniref:Recombinase family protein n=1 Tax=Acetobacter estunensis TaxID=104097 RepID=A0A967B787_9PROT|nr:recombinase family protein [Acetobacter estunensis]NHO55175.1 recombinase family protein [Acetobacter estunensis]GBQ27120.1 DNA resolvase [Acetobacter estunensis NRIC 0472]
MAVYGYARVSTAKQDLKQQIEALKKAGISEDHIFQDTLSGSTDDRPGLNKLLSLLNEGDTLTIWKIDRLGRSFIHICEMIEQFRERGIIVKSISDGLTYDPNNIVGRMLFQQMATFAEFERAMIHERIHLGIAYARKHGTRSGKPIGRPTASSPRVRLGLDLISQGQSYRQASRATGVPASTLGKYAKEAREQGELAVQTNIFDAIGSAG